MILNGYDTLVGGRFKLSNNVESTLKTLATTNRLTPYNKRRNVFCVDHSNGDLVQSFVFPITLKDYRGNLITVFDMRNYANKNGVIVNQSEFTMIEAASVFQQMAAQGDKSPLTGPLKYTAKAFARGIGGMIARQSSMDKDRQLELEVILAHYYNCLLTNPNDDYIFVSQNVIKAALGYEPTTSLPIIQEVGYISTLRELLNTLIESPRLPQLNKFTLSELVNYGERQWSIGSGFKMILGAALELPHFYTAICYATVLNNKYNDTQIGKILDKRNDGKILDFVRTVNETVNQ